MWLVNLALVFTGYSQAGTINFSKILDETEMASKKITKKMGIGSHRGRIYVGPEFRPEVDKNESPKVVVSRNKELVFDHERVDYGKRIKDLEAPMKPFLKKN